MHIKVCVFDAYGTLFDVAAAARRAADEPTFAAIKDSWAALANDWRLKQLEYTWLRAITKTHCDFWQVTRDGLDYALELHGLSGDDALKARLLELYWELDAYVEVPSLLSGLKDAGYATAILSNGSPSMLNAAVQSAGLNTYLDDVLSVEDVGVFKPDAPCLSSRGVIDLIAPQIKSCLCRQTGGMRRAPLVLDFKTVWVNRANIPQDRLAHGPEWVMSDLSTIIPEVLMNKLL